MKKDDGRFQVRVRMRPRMRKNPRGTEGTGRESTCRVFLCGRVQSDGTFGKKVTQQESE